MTISGVSPSFLTAVLAVTSPCAMACMFIMLSPPGLFSITTGLPQRACRRSWMRRAPISAPAPGPKGMMKRTGPCGQACVCACADGADAARVANSAMIEIQSLDISKFMDERDDGRMLVVSILEFGSLCAASFAGFGIEVH